MKRYLSAAALLLVVSHTAHSQQGNPMLGQLATFGGATEAAVEACGLDVDTTTAKRQQREQFAQMGGTNDAFETAYQAGYQEAKDGYESATPAERQEMCDQFKSLMAGNIQ